MFTKQHYEVIAKIIKDNTSIAGLLTKDTDIILRYGLIYELADYFQKDNPNFDRDKFITASGGRSNVL